MKYAPALLLLCLNLVSAESSPVRPSQPAAQIPSGAHEATMTFQRVMIAGPGGQRICTGAYGFKLKDHFLQLDASAPECAELANLDTAKPCTVEVAQDPARPISVILRVEQNGKTLYTRPAPKKE